jgi:uncharacterized lipoprotein YmbA
MNARRLIWVASLMVTACASASEIRYYALSAEPATEVVAVRNGTVRYAFDAVAIPDLLDRPQIVLRAGQYGIDMLDDDRWAAPLPDLLQRVLAADLSSRLGAGSVVDPGLPSPRSARRITVSILEFGASRDGQSVIEASWTISDPESAANGTIHRARHVAATDGTTVAAIVATMSRLLARLADDIAATSDPSRQAG